MNAYFSKNLEFGYVLGLHDQSPKKILFMESLISFHG